jgi:hypothetical protein
MDTMILWIPTLGEYESEITIFSEFYDFQLIFVKSGRWKSLKNPGNNKIEG